MAKKRKPIPRKFTLHKVTLLFQGIPRDVRDQFKGYCARRGLTMKERIVELMLQDINSDIRAMKVAPLAKKQGKYIDDQDD